MKEFKIPMIDQSFILFIGEDDFVKFAQQAKKEYPDAYKYEDEIIKEECAGLTGGFTVHRLVWIGNTHDKNLIYHELSHMLHSLYLEINAVEENEFKAYLSAYIYCEVFNHIDEIKEPIK